MEIDISTLIRESVQRVTQQELTDSIWSTEPVSPKEFFEKWCPPALSPVQLEVFETLIKNKEWNKEYVEYLLFWGEGSGKDFISTRMLVYAGYFLMCMCNPQEYFGMASTEPIDLVNISVNAPHAKNVFFKRFTDTIKRVINPRTGKNWFEEQGMDLRDGKDIQTTKVRFTKNITAHSLNSEKYSAEGNNILLAVFDEVAEFKPHKAKEIYDGLIYNAESRWGSTEGSPYRIILLSYLRHEHDFMNFRWKQSQHEERVYRSKKCTWEVRPDKSRADYDNAFKKNPEEASRRYANIMPEGSGNTFFQQKDTIREIVNTDRVPPFVENVYATDDLNNLTLKQWFRPNTIQHIERLRRQGDALPDDKKKELERLEEIHGDNRYYIHIDLAKGDESKANDCAGFVMVHPFRETWDNEEYSIYVDLMMQIKKQKGEINFEAIRKFIYKLQDMGFNIAGVSLDGYQSVDFRQQMIAKGLNCEIISMDRDSTPYNTVKELIYTDRIDYYEYKVVLRELEELIRDKDKVDHPEQSYLRSLEEGVERGSKDVADALAGATFNALTNAEDEDADWFGV